MTAIATLPKLTCQGIELDLSPDKFGWLESSIDLADDPTALVARMDKHGYLFLPGLLNRDDVKAARVAVAGRLADKGYLDPDYPIEDLVALKDPKFWHNFSPDVAAKAPELEKVVYGPTMMRFFDRFLGEPALHFDFTWFRTVMPGFGTVSHCDSPYMNRGEKQRLYTAWTPVGDVSLDIGGLLILEGSNSNQRLRETYGRMDVDSYCMNHPEEKDGPVRVRTGSLGKNPLQIQKSIGGRWLTRPDYRMGDVLIFSIYTIHASLDNHTRHVRLSADTRYQPASSPADERWMGAEPVGHGKAGKRGRVC